MSRNRWGVLLKIALADSSRPMDENDRHQLAAALPGDHKAVTSGERDVTAKFWVDGDGANEALETAADLIKRHLRQLQLDPATVIRTHAASYEGRRSLFRGVDARQGDRQEWSLMIKVSAPPGDRADALLLRRVIRSLADPDASVSLSGDGSKFLADDGSGFNVRLWVRASDPSGALRVGRSRITKLLEAIGRPDWPIVRAHLVTPEERANVVFVGAAVVPPNQIARSGE